MANYFYKISLNNNQIEIKLYCYKLQNIIHYYYFVEKTQQKNIMTNQTPKWFLLFKDKKIILSSLKERRSFAG